MNNSSKSEILMAYYDVYLFIACLLQSLRSAAVDSAAVGRCCCCRTTPCDMTSSDLTSLVVGRSRVWNAYTESSIDVHLVADCSTSSRSLPW